MTIDTTKGPQPDTRSEMAIEPPSTSTPQPGLEVPHASSEPDLQSRIKVRRVELVERLRELKTDKRREAAEASDKLKAKLSELAHILKWGVVDGWANLGDGMKHRLEHWLAESKPQLPTRDVPSKTVQS
ncbi:MAG TPA: hypothetical protein VF469_04080 [Kofleriaceae bacterium]